MHISFPYPGIAPVEIPDANLLGVYEPQKLDSSTDAAGLIANALDHPIGAPRIEKLAASGKPVLILSDDGTRGTPVEPMLDALLPRLTGAGVEERKIEVLIAKGSHRAMNEAELKLKLGAYAQRLQVHQHDYLDSEEIHDWGKLDDGFPVLANRRLRDAGLVIGLGHIGVHRIKGFSGGSKIVFPGCAGYESAAANHWLGAQMWAEQLMGVRDNRLRQRIDDAARRAGLNYIVNLVLAPAAPGGEAIAGCFAGDPVEAHRRGCQLAERIYAVELPRRAEIVLVDSHPADRDFWQSAKGIYCGTMAVRRNGCMILVTSSPEGVAENHPVLLEQGSLPYDEIVRRVENREIRDVMGAAVMAYTAQALDHADIILVSSGICPAEARQLGFRPAVSVQTALAMAFLRQGREAQVAVLRSGGSLLPRIAGEAVGRRPAAA